MTTTAPTRAPQPGSNIPMPSLVGGRMAWWMPYAVFAVSFGASALITILAGGFSWLGMTLIGALLFLVIIYFVARAVEGRRWAADRLAKYLIYGAFILVMLPLFSLIAMVLVEGLARFNWTFLSSDMNGIYGETPDGGAWHAIVGTLLVTGIAALISIPLGIFTAIYLVEYRGGRIAKALTFLVDVMTGIPSIVAGLFAFSLFTILIGPDYKAGVIGSIALAVLMTPVVIRGTEEMLKLVPNELREASYALGVPKWLTIVKVVLRTAIAGITTSVMIAIARVAGETAPLLITIGILPNLNANPFDGRMTTLPVFVYRQYAQGGDSNTERAWAGALTLIIIVMILNLAARLVSRYFSPKGLSR